MLFGCFVFEKSWVFLRNVYLLVDLGKSNQMLWWVVFLVVFFSLEEPAGTLNNGKLFLQTAVFLVLGFFPSTRRLL